jgi:hypothetical protein
MVKLLMSAVLVIVLAATTEALSKEKAHVSQVDRDLVRKACTGQNVNACSWCNAISCSVVAGCKGSKCTVQTTTTVTRTAPTGKPTSVTTSTPTVTGLQSNNPRQANPKQGSQGRR